MDVFVNYYMAPEKVERVFGTRTLVLANNTKKEGYFFKDVFLWVERQAGTSVASINYAEGKIREETVGVYLGIDIKPLSGVRFEGKTKRDGVTHCLILASPGAEIIEDGELWFLDEHCGWISLGVQEENYGNGILQCATE